MGIQKRYDDGSLGYTLILDIDPQIATPDASGDHASASIGTTVNPVNRRLKMLNDPPGTPATDDAYMVGTGTGDWAGHDNEIATYNGAAWVFSEIVSGDRFIVLATSEDDWATHDNEIASWNGSAWSFAAGTTGDSVRVKDILNADGDKDLIVFFNGTTWGTTFTVITLDQGFEVVGDATGKYVYLGEEKREVASNTLTQITVTSAFTADIRNSSRIHMLPAEMGACDFQVRWSWPITGTYFISSFSDTIITDIQTTYVYYLISIEQDRQIPSFSFDGDIATHAAPIDKETNIVWGAGKENVGDETWSATQENYQWALHAMNAMVQKGPGTNGGQYNHLTGKYETLAKYDSPQWCANDASGVPYEGAGVVIGAMCPLPHHWGYNPNVTVETSRVEHLRLHPEYAMYREFNDPPVWSPPFGNVYKTITFNDGDPGSYENKQYPMSIFVQRATSVEIRSGDTVYTEGVDYILDKHNGYVTRIPTGSIARDATVTAISSADIALYDVAPTSIWSEDPDSGEVDPQGGIVGFDPNYDSDNQYQQSIMRNGSGNVWYYSHDLYIGALYSSTEGFLGALCGRGVGLKTNSSGCTPGDLVTNANDGTVDPDRNNSQPVPKGSFPEKDGVSFIAAGNGNIQIGPFPALKGRLRGIAPCAKVICYFPSGGHAASYGRGFDTLGALSNKLKTMQRAIEHKVHILVEPLTTYYPELRLSETEYQAIHAAWKEMNKANIMYVAASHAAGFNTGRVVGSGLDYIWGDTYNTVFVGGHGPRYYNPAAPDLNKYDPANYDDPPQRENNLFRPAMGGARFCPRQYNFDGDGTINMQHSTVVLGFGSGLTYNRDFVVPQGCNDPYLLAAAVAADPWTNYYNLNNSAIYCATSREGLQEGWGTTATNSTKNHFVPVANIGFHGATYNSGVTAAHAAGALALAVEASIRESGGSSPKMKKIRSAAKKKARDGVGPVTDDVFITADYNKNVFMQQQMGKCDGAFPIVSASRGDFIVPITFKIGVTAFGSNPFGFPGAVAVYPGYQVDENAAIDPESYPGGALVTTAQALNYGFSFFFGSTSWNEDGRYFDTVYFPSFPADKPGKDLLMGYGAMDIKELCDYIRVNGIG